MWVITAALLLLALWHAANWIRFHSSYAAVMAAVMGGSGMIMVWVGAASRRDYAELVAHMARNARRTGLEDAYQLSVAWQRQRLTMPEAELAGAAFWAVQLATERVGSSHGRRGLAEWDYEPGETIERSIYGFSPLMTEEWRRVKPRVLEDTSANVVVLGDDYVTTYAAAPVDHPDRVVAVTIKLTDVVDMRGYA